jgi:hypothetical protein
MKRAHSGGVLARRDKDKRKRWRRGQGIREARVAG